MQVDELLIATKGWIETEEVKDSKSKGAKLFTLVSLSYCVREAAKQQSAPEDMVTLAMARLRKVTVSLGMKTYDVFSVSEAKAIIYLATCSVASTN